MRALLALAALVAVLFAGVIGFTGHLARSETLRAGLTQEIRDALGLDLVLGEVTVGVLPPRVELVDSAIPLRNERELEVGRAAFEVALIPLLTEARADVRTVTIDGPITLHSNGARATAIAKGQLERIGRDAWSLEIAGALETGGDFELSGSKNPVETRLVLAIDDVDLVPLVALAPKLSKLMQELEGLFDGRFDLTSTGDTGRVLAVELSSKDANLRAKDVIVDGPVDISARLDWLGAFPLGPFEIDASNANVGYAIGGLRAATGAGAKLSGVLVEKKGSMRIDAVRLSVSGFQGKIGGS